MKVGMSMHTYSNHITSHIVQYTPQCEELIVVLLQLVINLSQKKTIFFKGIVL